MENFRVRAALLTFSLIFSLCAVRAQAAPVEVTFTQSELVTMTEQPGTAGTFEQVSPTATAYTLNSQFKFFRSGTTFADPALGTASGSLHEIPGTGCDVADYAGFPAGGIALLGDPSFCMPIGFSTQIAAATAAGAAGAISITSLADVTFLNVALTSTPSIPTLFVSSTVGDALLAILNDTAPPSTYTIGGSISGLSGSVTLQNNGGDNLTRSVNGGFVFATPLADSSAYAVSVFAQPSGQTCSVTNGSGTVDGADIASVEVSCTDNPVSPQPPGDSATPVPTLSGTALGLLILSALILGFRGIRRAR